MISTAEYKRLIEEELEKFAVDTEKLPQKRLAEAMRYSLLPAASASARCLCLNSAASPAAI